MIESDFYWDDSKNELNLAKHKVSFEIAQYAFNDPKRIIARDVKHSTTSEQRFFCYGLVQGNIITVRFTLRNDKIRIFGAGYWREGRKKYNEKNNLH
ncbi:MAG TPA: hypothetical protein DCO75_10565 [Fibrobacteres bacterium]|nr:hypothetical protein [Fibrobacterota bacterium]